MKTLSWQLKQYNEQGNSNIGFFYARPICREMGHSCNNTPTIDPQLAN